MSQEVILSGLGGQTGGAVLRKALRRAKPEAVGIASAFVSVKGVQELEKLLNLASVRCRLVAGLGGKITHPGALYRARELGCEVRLGVGAMGIFHPKLIVAGDNFEADGSVSGTSLTYVGSANLTNGGLSSNVECGLLATDGDCHAGMSEAFARLWNLARIADDAALAAYAEAFARSARTRTAKELVDLGINDGQPISTTPTRRSSSPPPVVSHDHAVAVWAGLESSTGEYRYQPELPKPTGTIVDRIVQAVAPGKRNIQVFSPDDRKIYLMTYAHYSDNRMFRVNVPKEFPGADWAQRHKSGLILIKASSHRDAILEIRFIRPGKEAEEIKLRSITLGTWGRTTTRMFGWY